MKAILLGILGFFAGYVLGSGLLRGLHIVGFDMYSLSIWIKLLPYWSAIILAVIFPRLK
ncbi:DUF5957 family protein [Evansella halocellulosilytica]|uniref:DUF5957 family protein n=1 Tax=Evansella halocellulosilytica TaxID=2011013 RepID=UPI0015CC2BFE|nr:DUF5957 family protein [Evansella halocellulosilytica]